MAAEASQKYQFIGNPTIDFPEISANTTEENEVTVSGARKDFVYIAYPEGTWDAGLTIPIGFGSDDGKIKFTIGNLTGGAINPASQTFKVIGL